MSFSRGLAEAWLPRFREEWSCGSFSLLLRVWAFVDFSQELISNHVGGTSAEELTVYSLSNTLIANFPAVKSVQFLVEGREVTTLAGHLDLTIPYGRGPRRLEQDQPSGP